MNLAAHRLQEKELSSSLCLRSALRSSFPQSVILTELQTPSLSFTYAGQACPLLCFTSISVSDSERVSTLTVTPASVPMPVSGSGAVSSSGLLPEIGSPTSTRMNFLCPVIGRRCESRFCECELQVQLNVQAGSNTVSQSVTAFPSAPATGPGVLLDVVSGTDFMPASVLEVPPGSVLMSASVSEVPPGFILMSTSVSEVPPGSVLMSTSVSEVLPGFVVMFWFHLYVQGSAWFCLDSFRYQN